MVKVNGTDLDLAGKTLAAYLEASGYDPKRIAVAVSYTHLTLPTTERV